MPEWEVFGYVKANPINYDGRGVSKRHVRITVPDKPSAERKALALVEEGRYDFRYVTFYPKEES